MSQAKAVDFDLVISGSLTPAAPITNDFRLAVVSGDSTLDGEDVAIYATASAAIAAEDDGFLSAGALAEALGAFANGAPEVAVIRYDAAASPTPEEPGDGLTRAADGGLAWYWTVIQSRVTADITDALDWIEANTSVLAPYTLIWQTADADAITGTPPAGEAALIASLRAWGVYEPTAAQVAAARWAGRFAAFNPDQRCVSGTPALTGGDAYDLTSPQASFAAANGYNVVVPDGTSRVVRLGHATPTEPVYSVISLDWYGLRAAQALVALRARYDASHRKLPLSEGGAGLVEARLAEVAEVGLAAEHFGPIPALPGGYAIRTSIDRPAREIVAEVDLGILDAVRTVRVTYLLDR